MDRSGNSVSVGFGKLDSSGEGQGEMAFEAARSVDVEQLEETMSGDTLVVAFIPCNCSN